jgi:hypothetical protein
MVDADIALIVHYHNPIEMMYAIYWTGKEKMLREVAEAAKKLEEE